MKRIAFALFAVLFFANTQFVQAQSPVRSELLEGTVISVDELADVDGEGTGEAALQALEIEITSGDLDGQIISVTSADYAGVHIPDYVVGDRLLIRYEVSESGVPSFQVQDYIRRTPLFVLLVLFIALAIIVGGVHGVRSLIGLLISFAVIFWFILPQIHAGRNPSLIAVIGATFIALVTFYVSHGVTKKTTTAIVGTFVSFVVTAILAQLFITWTQLSGFSSDESLFLQITSGDVVNVQGLLLAGIIIGALGILDDVTISQASIVQELKYADPSLSSQELFIRAMRVGRDHISSLINTLVLVYTAGALPLLLLYLNSEVSFVHFINYEIVAEEIIRTLAASIGLILAVPVTTLIAVRYLQGEKNSHVH